MFLTGIVKARLLSETSWGAPALPHVVWERGGNFQPLVLIIASLMHLVSFKEKNNKSPIEAS